MFDNAEIFVLFSIEKRHMLKVFMLGFFGQPLEEKRFSLWL